MSYNYLFKLVIIGNTYVGKSAIVKRLCDHKYLPLYNSTIGVDFSAIHLKMDSKNTVKLQIWDTAGQENFSPIIRSYYRGIAGVIMVYDICDRSSFKKLNFWLNELNNNKDVDHPIPVVLVGHKLDRIIRKVSREEGMAFATKNGLSYIEASAKTGYNIEEIFLTISKLILKNLENGYIIGTKQNPIIEMKSIELSSKRGEGNDFFTCCCLC
jgi:small GTP-binding protein